MDTIQIDGWLGHTGQGLAPRQLEATLWACAEKTAKEIARCMGCAPSTVVKQLDAAKFKMGTRTTRGLCLEAMRRGIIAPLVLALLVGGGHTQHMRPVRRPDAPRIQTAVRVHRADDAGLSA
jgi:DNA-binding CsgD family transcriptional regulator